VTASHDQWEVILQELLALVHEKLDRIRTMAAAHLLKGKPATERRRNFRDPVNGES
jgi:hypothetical protein